MEKLAIVNLDLKRSAKASNKVQAPKIMGMTKQNLLTVDCELPESQRPTLTTTPSQKSGRMKVKPFMRMQSATKTPSKESSAVKMQSFKLKERTRVYERLRKELDRKLEEPGLKDRVKQVILKQCVDLESQYADVLATTTKNKSKTPLKK